MMPIVHGLEAEFGSKALFLYENAADKGQGQAAFESLSLPGHPSYVLFSSHGSEVYRNFGIVGDAALRAAINKSLNKPEGNG